MERAVKNATQPAVEDAKIPRPHPEGTYAIQSMGRWIDRLMGDGKARTIAAELIEPLLMDRGDSLADPEPAEIPEPVPGGSEPITRGDESAGEPR